MDEYNRPRARRGDFEDRADRLVLQSVPMQRWKETDGTQTTFVNRGCGSSCCARSAVANASFCPGNVGAAVRAVFGRMLTKYQVLADGPGLLCV